ncbi:MAG: transglycosylase domain-containing protein [Bacteroidia bacterium]|nr:transglycosylase domain-containing protein [Bacteroidia bacterium]
MDKNKTPRGGIIKRALKWIGIVAAAGILFLAVIAVFTFQDMPPMTELENPSLNLSTQIYTADGKLLGNFYEVENRVYVPLNKISPHVADALIATEDVRFYNHSGIDPSSFPAIAWGLIRYQRMRGGSTITMQLARNLYDQVGTQRTATRKLKEMVVAAVLERKFTKEEIMEAYLNTACFYGNTYGVEMGARSLFGKAAADLEPHEAAMMVGLLKGPTYYNPRKYPERAKNRQETVIEQMEKYGFVDEKEALRMKREELKLKFYSGGESSTMAQYFKEHVKRRVKQWAEEEGKDINLFTDGLKVYTTIDSRMQNYAEEAVQEHLASFQATFDAELNRTGKPWVKNPAILQAAIEKTRRWKTGRENDKSKTELKEEFARKIKMRIWTWSGLRDTTMSPQDSVIHYMKFLETGFMAMDPQNAQIRAWVGGINFRYFQYDHVFQSKRQVGSTFKPFLYTAALDREAIQPCDKVLDVPVTIRLPDGKKWTPDNSGGQDDGLMNYMEGLAKSKNRVTASLMAKLGPEVVCEYARKLGIKSRLDCVPSLCLGVSDVSVYEMVAAYCTFANGGFYQEPQFITRIEDRFGNVMVEFTPAQERVINENTAYSMTAMLMNVVDFPFGTGHSLRSRYGFENQMGGKTGTTQNHSDGWFMGITPNLVAGTWVGCAEREVRFPTITYGQGARMALPIYALFMQKVYADRTLKLPREPFVKPDGYHVQLACPPLKEDTDKDPDELPFGI